MPTKNSVVEFNNLSLSAKNVCFLHSGQNGKSILAKNPIAKYKGSSITAFKNFVQKYKKCLLIGYISYDQAYKLHKVRKTAKNDLKLPEVYFLAFDKWQECETTNTIRPTEKPNSGSSKFKSLITKQQYHKAFTKIQHYLREGDVYQVNLTHRLEAETNLPPRQLFLRIIENNPVDFLAYIEGEGFEVLSASPERFIKIQNKHIETCPIKGTRPRNKNPKEDKKFQKELIESEKEAAELNMITDLLRNDLGKICKIGTVKVEGHRLLQKCPTVWHTYSKITGEIAKNPIDALISMLPGGSITGCPKKRAIEIIDELEPKTRGIYTGVIGYIHPNGTLNFNIAIRTIIKKGKKVYLQVGGGIVIDSKEEEEYKETLDKAKSFMNIL